MHSIVDILNIGNGIWSIVYTVPRKTGCCGLVDTRHNILIRSEKRPTKKEIDDEIKNQREGVQASMGPSGDKPVLRKRKSRR